MNQRMMGLLVAAGSAWCMLMEGSRAADWPQLQNGPQRLGYSAEKIDVPLKRAWAVGLSPERLSPQTQPVIAGGRVLLGTAIKGQVVLRWRHRVHSPNRCCRACRANESCPESKAIVARTLRARFAALHRILVLGDLQRCSSAAITRPLPMERPVPLRSRPPRSGSANGRRWPVIPFRLCRMLSHLP